MRWVFWALGSLAILAGISSIALGMPGGLWIRLVLGLGIVLLMASAMVRSDA